LSPDVLAGIAKLVDFCLVASAAALSFVLYHRSLGQDLPEWDRYGLSAVLGALLFVIGFLNAGGYELSRLKNLRWQLMRTTTIWATVASALLFLAFLCKMSDMYSRGRAIAALGFLTLARGLLHGAISRWTRQGKRLGAGQRARGEIDTVEKARQRVLFDLDYIDSWSLWLDAKILLMSSRVPFTRENAY
jgi:hypothetical protein